ncbi:glycoside hydrolase family 43 protein [Sphingobacterium composti Ten et al. 2007 non Yoo et al. 2007]|uniref:glycoside hydrolase family 43 protein n=1 Tax=Sphingobacterium composti TaxID=363260 RepID=UPI00135BAC54|nr:glycoside hydrolase family 43 protein [Sphingobacterium composti Ten et al. 2007 non Yoo et al. 2007]
MRCCQFSSDNLKDWKREGVVYDATQKNAWGISAFWATEVYERDGKFYMFYSAQWKYNPSNELENFKIGVAVADNPLGPFIDMYDKPIFNPDYPIIDANVFWDNGKVYMYYSRCCYKHPVESEISEWAKWKNYFNEVEESWIYVVELKPDFSGVIGEPKVLFTPPTKMNEHEWESRSVTSKEVGRRWTEGSYIFKHNDLYYMMYSSNNFDGENYAIGYATSKSPLGPFKKSVTNPILQKDGGVTGTGHNSLLLDNGKIYCVYHGRTTKTGHKRMVFIDELEITKNGRLIIHGPTLHK